MAWLKNTALKIGRWLKDNPWAIIVALLGVFSAYRILKSKDNKISTLQDAVAVQATKSKMAGMEARAKALKERADAREGEVKELDDKIAASKRRIVEIHEEKLPEGASDEEIAAMFDRSGL